jgi:hypothetical protein
MLDASEWMTEIENALDYRERYGRERSWDKMERNYLNDPNSHTAAGPNLFFSMGDALLSGLIVPDPEFVVSATHPQGVDRAPVVEAIDNKLVSFLKLKRHVERALLHSYLKSRAILKIGYDSEFGWSPYYDIGAYNNLAGMTFTQFDKKGKRIEFKDTKPGMPWVSAVDPRDFVVPWGTIDLEDAPWAAFRFVRLNTDLKADPKFVNTSKLEPQISMEAYMESYRRSGGKRIRQRRAGRFELNREELFNECWEIHDRRTGMVFVVTPDYEKFLRKNIDALQVCGLPFVSSTFIEHPNSFWSTPQAYYLGQLQKEQYDIAVQGTKQRRINILRFLMDGKAMTDDEANKLISGDVGAIAKTTGTRSVRDAFAPVPTVTNLDLNLQAENLRRDARDAIGKSRNQLGEFDASSRRTARETMQVAAGAGKRDARRSSCVVDLYVDTMRKINKLIFTYWKFPRWMMVDEKWVSFTGEEIEGEYLYDLSLSTKRSVSTAERKVEALMLVSQLAQVGVPLQPLMKYVVDAANDPSFERLFAQAGGSKSTRQLPTGQVQGPQM